jgi:hypothetical protein
MISAPIAKANKMTVGDVTSGVTNVKKEEYICDIKSQATTLSNGNRIRKLSGPGNGLGAFLLSIPLQIGSELLSKWGSNFAQNFTKYAFNALEFIFKPSASTATPGNITMCPSYDPTETKSTEKSEYMNKAGTVVGPLWDSLSCRIDPRKMYSSVNSHSIRSGPATSETDLKSTDPGTLDVFFEAAATNGDTPLGQLHVKYDVNLETAKQQTNEALSRYYQPMSGFYKQTIGNQDSEINLTEIVNATRTIQLTFSKPSSQYMINMVQFYSSALGGDYTLLNDLALGSFNQGTTINMNLGTTGYYIYWFQAAVQTPKNLDPGDGDGYPAVRITCTTPNAVLAGSFLTITPVIVDAPVIEPVYKYHVSPNKGMKVEAFDEEEGEFEELDSEEELAQLVKNTVKVYRETKDPGKSELTKATPVVTKAPSAPQLV